MRIILLLLNIFNFLTTTLISQENLDNIWLLGYTPNDSAQSFGGTQIDFNTSPPSINFFNVPFSFNANASICDTTGQLLFYTNGCHIANRNHETMAYGDSINPGFNFDIWCKDLGYPSHQGILILPFPGNIAKYAVVYFGDMDISPFDHSELIFSIVDMAQQNGLGRVTDKNQLIYEHQFLADNLMAVRHGNGRDWWIIVPKRFSNRYFKFLLTPEGFRGPFVQDFGKKWTNTQGGSQACFSPDGDKYVRMAPFETGCQIADFDRCSGMLSNAVNLFFPGDTIYSNGCAVSSNNRFLYISAYKKVYQFDLQAQSISASRVLLGEYDGTMAPFATRFFQAMLAPDDKIYITSPSSVYVMHVIHNPNEKGLACNFEQHGVELPTHIFFPIPNFPHYRLGDLPGSPCDTLGINGTVSVAPPLVKTNSSLRIFPNPAGSDTPIRIEAGELFEPNDRLSVYNAQGQLWRDMPLPQGKSHLVLPAGAMPAGVYFFQLQRVGGWVQRGKVVVGK